MPLYQNAGRALWLLQSRYMRLVIYFARFAEKRFFLKTAGRGEGEGIAMPYAPKRHRPAPAGKQHNPRAKEQHAKNVFYGRRWKAERLAYIQANPLCEACLRAGKTVPAQDVHHDGDNRAALCRACHNKITHGMGGDCVSKLKP